MLVVVQLYSDHLALAAVHIHEVEYICGDLHIGHRDIGKKLDDNLWASNDLYKEVISISDQYNICGQY
jgi:hypothetical protein